MDTMIMLSICIVGLYLLSRLTVRELFWFLKRTFRRDGIAFTVLAILFFPGTVLHEMAHYLAAVLLLLKVKSVHLLPEWDGHEIKLGKVIYLKADPFRGILVGVAPVLAGILALFALSAWGAFPNHNPWLTLAFGYIILIVTTTMFSSRQDLVDAAIVVPVLAGVAAAGYLLHINPLPWLQSHMGGPVFPAAGRMLERVNRMCYFALAIHGVFISVMWLIRRRSRPR